MSKSFKKTIWILTEERPKKEIIAQIINLYDRDAEIKNINVVPKIIDEKFSFKYEIQGVSSKKINLIYLKIVTGVSSFVDHLLFESDYEPNEKNQFSNLVYAIEETKTDSSESRNTAAAQRATKFAFLRYFQKKNNAHFELYMLFNKSEKQNKKDPDSVVFIKRCWKTLGVKILGDNSENLESFKSVQELILEKNKMRKPPKGNIPVRIRKENDQLFISGVLSKPKDKGNIGNDPNIGQLIAIAHTLRQLGWKQKITIEHHYVEQEYINKNPNGNKFLFASKMYGIGLDRIDQLDYEIPKDYWKYDKRTEKIATILLHVLLENLPRFKLVYENHAGGERGYFYDLHNEISVIPKRNDNNKNINLPDLVFADLNKRIVYICEGEMRGNEDKGLVQIEDFNLFEQKVKLKYSGFEIKRFLIISNGNSSDMHSRTLFQVNSDGSLEYGKLFPDDLKKILVSKN